MSNEANEPLIPHTQNLAEITVKAIIISIILTIVLGASNAYLGMKVGTTISASIPAAVIAMGVLHFFRRQNVLEINIIQTAASAGEATAAACIFTFPALLITHFWFHFHYFTMVGLVTIGGIIGVLFSVLLRRVLLADKTLRFPEGVAIGNVLKASVNKTLGLKYLVQGGAVGGLVSFLQTGLQVLADSSSYWIVRSSSIWGISCDFTPALIASGYIVGYEAGRAILLGIIISWFVVLPYMSSHSGLDLANVGDAVHTVYTHYIRYIGVGALIAGGVWTIIRLLKPVAEGVRTSLQSMRLRKHADHGVIRTELDIPINYATWVTLALLVPLFFILMHLIKAESLGITQGMYWAVMAVAILGIVIVGFVVASVSGYFAGLVGSSNNPLSSMIISAAILISLALLLLMSTQVDFKAHPNYAEAAIGVVILLVATIAVAGTITNDTIQDLKAGQMVGATPWKQQVMLIFGVMISALVIPPILELLYQAYGIGGVYPRPGMDPQQMLSAPQANLVAAVTTGMFGGGLDWKYLMFGGAIGVVCIIIDEFLKTRGSRLPVMAVGLGIYLPYSLTLALALGGGLSYLVQSRLKTQAETQKNPKEYLGTSNDRIMLVACGLVAGASLMGVILAIPFAISQSTNVLAIMPASLSRVAAFASIAVMIGIIVWLYRVACGRAHMSA